MLLRSLSCLFLISVLFGSSYADDNRLLSASKNDAILGDANAKVTLIEYSSLSCPSCALFHEHIFPELKYKYIDRGKVKYIHRNYPLNHVAALGAQLLLCVPKPMYYKFLQALFDTQSAWVADHNPQKQLLVVAQIGGLTKEQAESCFTDSAVEEEMIQIKKDGHNILEVNATPTFFVNGEKISGVPSKERFFKILDQHFADING